MCISRRNSSGDSLEKEEILSFKIPMTKVKNMTQKFVVYVSGSVANLEDFLNQKFQIFLSLYLITECLCKN